MAKPLSRGWDNLSQSLQRITGTILSGGKFILKKHYRYIDHYILIRRFVETVKNNAEPPVTAQEGRETVKTLEEIAIQIDDKLREAK